MALAAIKVTIGQSLGGGQYNASIGAGTVPDFATVTADVATLVADGATPTQGHVNTLNTDYTALAAATSADVVLIFDAAVVTNQNQLKAALQKILLAAASGIGGLTP